MELSREELLRELPEINQIQDERLREQVIAVWQDVARESPHATLAECPWGSAMPHVRLMDHIRSVTRVALALADVLSREDGHQINRDILLAGALLHDVSKIVEFTRDEQGNVVHTDKGRMLEHAFIGAAVARSHGLPLEVLHIINGHSPYSPVPPRTLEAVVLTYADLAQVDTLYFSAGILSDRLAKRR